MGIMTKVGVRFVADNRSARGFNSFNRSLARTGRQLLTMVGVGGGLYGFKRLMEGAVSAAGKQEEAERALIAAVKGRIDQYKTFAAEMQKQTKYGDELILNQMAYATNLGVTTDKLKEATVAAIGLAARFKIDLASAMMLVGRASQGQTQLLTRYGIVIDQTLSDQDKFNALLKIGAGSFRLAQEEAKTSVGIYEQYKNAMGDIAEVVGEPLMKNLTDLAKWMTNNKKQILDFIETVERPIKALIELHRIASALPDLNQYEENSAAALRQQRMPAWGPNGFYFTNPQEQGLPVGTLDIPPERMQHLAEMRARLRRMDEAGKMSQGWLKEPMEPATYSVKPLSAEQKKAAEIRGKYIPLIEKEIALTGKVGEAHWHAAKMIELETALQKANIQNTAEGIELREEMVQTIDRLSEAQKLARIADDIGDSFASAFETIITRGGEARDVIKALLRDIASSVLRNLIIQPLAAGISAGIGGAMGIKPPSGQHGGEVLRTGLAVIHKGETLSGVNNSYGGRGDVVINFQNLGTPQGMVSYDQQIAENKRIITVVVNDAIRGGAVKGMVKEIIASS
jgi:hypothetical protein